jgi:GNAT superfamily N-acetyltransferase
MLKRYGIMIIDIKTLTKVQFNQLIELVKLYFKETDNEILDDGSATSYINNIEKQLEKHQALHYFVSEDNGLINGFLLGNTLYNYNNEECSFILELYVSKENRLQGIGRKLVEKFESISKDVIYLTAHKDAEKFYRSIGYITTNNIDKDNGNNVYKKNRN